MSQDFVNIQKKYNQIITDLDRIVNSSIDKFEKQLNEFENKDSIQNKNLKKNLEETINIQEELQKNLREQLELKNKNIQLKEQL